MNLCSVCKSPYHPASGHAWTENARLCLRCTLDWMKWLKGREGAMGGCLKRKGKEREKESFSECALRSIGARKKKDPIDRWLEKNTGLYGKDEEKDEEGLDKPQKQG